MGIDRNINREYWNKSRFYYPIFFDHEFQRWYQAPEFIRGINPKSKIENPQERAFISRKSI